MDEEEFEAIVVGEGRGEDDEQKEESLRLKQRLQYYQNYSHQNHPDNPDSSDDEANQEKRHERGSLESKSAAENENSDFDEEDEAPTNQYAPLEEIAVTLDEDQEEFGDFVSTNIGIESRLMEIDSILNTDNPNDLENNFMFNRLLGEDRRYIRSTISTTQNEIDGTVAGEVEASSLTSSEVEERTVEQSLQKEGVAPVTAKPESVEPAPYRSIAPLTQEKVKKIKDIMAGIKIKPPSSIGTMALLDSLDSRRMRLGDEVATHDK